MEDKEKPTINVERRRPGSSTPTTQRERAEAPSRQRERQSVTGGSGSSSYQGVPSIPGLENLLRSPIGIGAIILLFICGLIHLLAVRRHALSGRYQPFRLPGRNRAPWGG